MDAPSTSRQYLNGPRYAIHGLIFALIVCALAVGAAAGWMRYTKKKSCGFTDAAQQAMGGLLPQFSPGDGWLPTGGFVGNAAGKFTCPQCGSFCWTQVRGGCPLCPFCRRAMVADSPAVVQVAAAGVAEGRFICPQCGSYCMTQTRRGVLVCPFCKQQMVEEVPGVLPVAGVAAGTAAPIPIQAGVKSTHENRGVCTNCHTVVRSVNSGLAPAIQAGITSPHRKRGECTACHSVVQANGLGPVPMISANAVAIHPDRGACANCHIVIKRDAATLKAAALTPAAAATTVPQAQAGAVVGPPILPNAVKPLLIKPLGMEVCPAVGDGAKVTGVMGNSNASRAELVAGDIIVECNGKKVADAAALQQLIAAAAPEANAQLKVIKNGRLQKVAVMVGEGEMEGFTPIPVTKP